LFYLTLNFILKAALEEDIGWKSACLFVCLFDALTGHVYNYMYRKISLSQKRFLKQDLIRYALNEHTVTCTAW